LRGVDGVLVLLRDRGDKGRRARVVQSVYNVPHLVRGLPDDGVGLRGLPLDLLQVLRGRSLELVGL
jgi:hypothetical protein